MTPFVSSTRNDTARGTKWQSRETHNKLLCFKLTIFLFLCQCQWKRLHSCALLRTPWWRSARFGCISCAEALLGVALEGQFRTHGQKVNDTFRKPRTTTNKILNNAHHRHICDLWPWAKNRPLTLLCPSDHVAYNGISQPDFRSLQSNWSVLQRDSLGGEVSRTRYVSSDCCGLCLSRLSGECCLVVSWLR